MTYKRGSRGEGVKKIQRALHLYPDGIFGPLTEEAVMAFQAENGLKVDGVVGDKTMEKMGIAIQSQYTGLKKTKRKVTEIIVHCTATPEGRECSVAEIRKWHKARGFSDIGYHYVVHLDGRIEPGRDVDISGAHCTGHNACSIGVCYVGGCANDGKLTPKDTRTARQKDALTKLLKMLKAVYPGVKIYGHRDFARKACPSFDATSEYRGL